MDCRLKTFALVAFLWPAAAPAQEITRYGGTSATSYALDGQLTPTLAFSLRRLLTSYSTNKLIRIRRASDNAELDIGFTATGDLDTAAATAHCNATTCFLRTWFDQSGAALDCAQATPANQMTLVFNCNGSLPCFRMTAGNHFCAAPSLTPSGIVSLSTVANRSAGAGICPFVRQINIASNYIRTVAGPNAWQLTAGTSLQRTATDNVWHAANGVIAGASSVFNVDGSEIAGTTTGSVTPGTPGIAGVAATTCNSAEAMLWDNYQRTAGERAALRANQKAYWGTP